MMRIIRLQPPITTSKEKASFQFCSLLRIVTRFRQVLGGARRKIITLVDAFYFQLLQDSRQIEKALEKAHLPNLPLALLPPICGKLGGSNIKGRKNSMKKYGKREF